MVQPQGILLLQQEESLKRQKQLVLQSTPC